MKNSYPSPKDKAAHHLFQNNVDPIVLTDSSGTIVAANERTFNLLGYEFNELSGNHISEIFAPDQSLPDFSSLPLVVDATIPVKETQEVLHVKIYATQYNDEDHTIVQWILHDITRQVELDQLRQDLAAMLVHDLQGPLGNVLYSLELVSNELHADSSETVRLMLDTAYRSSQHLQYLVDSMMDISHLEAGYPISNQALVDASELIDYVIAVEEPNLEQRGIIAKCTVTPDLPHVLANESMLRRIMLNLLDNALKHSQNGQTVIISAEREESMDMVRFSVLDQGKGVPEAYRDLIFEKFQRVRTSSSSSGLGLGLAFCRLAVKAHGGRIWVEETASGGACFCFTMPIGSDEPLVSAGKAGD
jgi:PAS domain S-box-containing protein